MKVSRTSLSRILPEWENYVHFNCTTFYLAFILEYTGTLLAFNNLIYQSTILWYFQHQPIISLTSFKYLIYYNSLIVASTLRSDYACLIKPKNKGQKYLSKKHRRIFITFRRGWRLHWEIYEPKGVICDTMSQVSIRLMYPKRTDADWNVNKFGVWLISRNLIDLNNASNRICLNEWSHYLFFNNASYITVTKQIFMLEVLLF